MREREREREKEKARERERERERAARQISPNALFSFIFSRKCWKLKVDDMVMEHRPPLVRLDGSSLQVTQRLTPLSDPGLQNELLTDSKQILKLSSIGRSHFHRMHATGYPYARPGRYCSVTRTTLRTDPPTRRWWERGPPHTHGLIFPAQMSSHFLPPTVDRMMIINQTLIQLRAAPTEASPHTGVTPLLS